MGGTIADEREALERELERLESLLALNANWQALRLLKTRAPVGGADRDPELVKLEKALEGNRVFQERRRIAEAIASIDGLVPAQEDDRSEAGAIPFEAALATDTEPVVSFPARQDRLAEAGTAEPNVLPLVALEPGEWTASAEDAEVEIATRARAPSGQRRLKAGSLPASLQSRLRRARQ